MNHRSTFLSGHAGNGTAKKQRPDRVSRGRYQKQICYDQLPAPKPLRPSSDYGSPPMTAVTAIGLAAAATGTTTPQQQRSSVNVVSVFGGSTSPRHQFARNVQPPPSRRVDEDDDYDCDMSPLPSLRHTMSGGTPRDAANGGGGSPSGHGGAVAHQSFNNPRVHFTEAYTPDQGQLYRIDSNRSLMSNSTLGSTRSAGRGGRGGRFLSRQNSRGSVVSRVSVASHASSAASELNFYNMEGQSSTTSINSDYNSINSRNSYQPTARMYPTSLARNGSASANSRRGMNSDSTEISRPWNPMSQHLLDSDN